MTPVSMPSSVQSSEVRRLIALSASRKVVVVNPASFAAASSRSRLGP